MPSTAQLNAAGYADTPDGRAQYAAGQKPSGAGAATAQQQANGAADMGWAPQTTNGGGGTPSAADIASFLNLVGGASASGNMAQFQELIREFNLNFGNTMAGTYGQNFGPGVLAPQTASSLAASQAVGSVGYIPGFSGLTMGQTQSELAQQAQTAQGSAGLTGWYAQPAQSQWLPGTFVRLDPGTYDTTQYGDVQISYVQPSGQLMRVNIPQARAMGWDGDLSKMPTTTAQNAIMLERAPPQNLPQQTLQGLSTYANLNAQAQNSALAESGVTGMYARPAAVMPPGTNLNGGKFSDLDQGTQQAYFMSNGSDWNAAMNKWVGDSNKAIREWAAANNVTLPGDSGTPQETLQAQNQYFTQGQDLAQMYGQYYTPLRPGEQGQAGVNMPNVGQSTLGAQQQQYNQGTGLVSLINQMQANPFKQQQAMGQLNQLLGNGAVSGFGQTQTVNGLGQAGQAQAAAQAGLPASGGGAGLGYLQQMIDDIRSPAANTQGMNQVMDAIPTPNKMNSVQFFKAPQSTQNLVLQGMQEKYGIDPTDAYAQLKNTLPGFQAPATFGTVKRPTI